MTQLQKTNIFFERAKRKDKYSDQRSDGPPRLKFELILQDQADNQQLTTLIWSVSSAEKAIPNVYLSVGKLRRFAVCLALCAFHVSLYSKAEASH
jgi:hypothetical protein